MGFFFVYILKSGVCLSLFYLFYRLLLSKETFYRFNRIALLGILVFSLLLPLIEVTKAPQNEINQAVLTIEQLLVMAENHQETQVTTVVEGDDLVDTWRSPVHWIEIVLLFYIAGIFFLVCRNVYSLFRLVRLMNTAQRRQIDKHTVLLVHDRNVAPFSWMKFVVISRTDLEENGREILIHECAHIRKHHSWDLLIADICIFFQWFNPGAWLLKQELQNIHEYEADEAVINEGINARDYQLLLIKKAVGTRLYSMANSFNHSKLKKRITMMLKEKSNPWAKLKYLYILPVAAIAVTAFARPEISETAEEISAVKVNDLTAIVEAKAVKSTEEVVQVATALKDTAKPVEVKYIPVEVTEKLQGTPFYEVVEQMPEYPGGIAASMEYIQKNMRYPEAAEKNGTQGRVTVQFIIDKEGNVTNPKVLRSVDKDLDAEAIRLVGAMPKWKPGMQKGKAVAVKYTLPVVFKLEGGEITSSQLVTERVAGTIRGEAVPLFIVDGKEVPSSIMGALRPESIESMTVLKDKSAAELYGEKGKNGVILITLRDKEYPIVIGSKNTNSTSTTLRVKGTSKSSTLPGIQNVYVNRKKADLGDAIIYVDGVEIESKEVDLGSVVPADRIESISVEKDSNSGKGKIYITTKDKKGAEKTSPKGDMKVEGFVQDKDGEPIVGASVLIEGTHTGSITDVDGRFVLSVSKGDKLIVSYINMATAKVKAEPKVIVTLKDE